MNKRSRSLSREGVGGDQSGGLEWSADSSEGDSHYSELDSESEISEGDSHYSGLGSESDEDEGTVEEEILQSADTSDEEEIRNTIGNIPLEWYDELSHIGYDIEGNRIAKSLSADGDEVDEFLAKIDDPEYWRTIKDQVTGQKVILSDEQVDMIQRLQKSSYPEKSVDPYEPYVDHFTGEKQLLPLSLVPKPKSSFIPSKWEHRKIVKLVHAIRMGWVKPHPKVPSKPPLYQLWGEGSDDSKRKHRMHIPAPRMPLPGHGESYNPPPEYLPTQNEREEWLAQDEEDRSTNYLPHKYGSLREVPAYPLFIKERFERCLDLYLCPRQRKMRVQVNPDDLIPQLPPLSDLQPFPTTEAMVYEGHSGVVQCVCVEQSGQWLASASRDCSVRLWEVATGRCVHTLTFPSQPVALGFSPSTNLSLLAIAVDKQVFFVSHNVGDHLVVKHTASFLFEVGESIGGSSEGGVPGDIHWDKDKDRLHITHTKPVKQVCWHAKGDYLATVTSDVSGSCVYIHQLSKARSQSPFKKLKGQVQCVLFHPFKPLFFLATQTCVRVYDLVRQELLKRLLSGLKWISSMAVHPSGDHLLLGSYDKKLCWFDLDLSSKPYRVLRQHKQAVRSVSFHPSLPLFASASDDGSVILCHGKIFNDLLQNPQIVPLKVLRGRGATQVDGLGVLEVVFHPSQPWLFTARADSTVRLYCN